jgi:hypothetical protein
MTGPLYASQCGAQSRLGFPIEGVQPTTIQLP